jgi:hypothetical protein
MDEERVHGRWTWTRNEYMDDGHGHSIHEQSECYTCKQYECNEYVRSALARSTTTIIRAYVNVVIQYASMYGHTRTN